MKKGNPDHLRTFRKLVNNAMDFTTNALNDLPKRPKYSVIHFYAAIELFLKARLLLEHWTLVIDDPGKANLASFQNGDFRSVTLTQSAERLDKILRQPLKDHEKECFKRLGEERNKMVHFIDATKTDQKQMDRVVFTELQAWHFIYRLLTKTWAEHFRRFNRKLTILNREVNQRLPQFGKAKFEAVSPEIDAEKKKGARIEKCDVCGFVASKIQVIRKNLHSKSCFVCESVWNCGRFLLIKCDCGQDMAYTEGGDRCNNCGKVVTADDLVNEYGPIFHPKHNLEPAIAHCGECEEEAVIEWGNDWLCLNCLYVHSEITNCNYCSSLITGSGEDSTLCGCFMCDGPTYPD